MELGDADHDGVGRRDAPAGDGLERRDEVGARHDRVPAQMRHGRMGAKAGHGDLEGIHRRHHRPDHGPDGPDRQPRPVVHPIHRRHGEAVHQPFLHHHPAAAGGFLGRLEDEIRRPVEPLRFGKIPCRSQQHGGVAVMPAGMHLPRSGRFVRDVVGLMDRKGIHVGPQADRLIAAMAGAQHADHSRLRYAAMDLQPELFEFPRHEIAGPVFLEAQLRMSVKVPAPAGQLAMHRLDAVIDLHWISRFFHGSVSVKCVAARKVRSVRRSRCDPLLRGIPLMRLDREPQRATLHYSGMVCRPQWAAGDIPRRRDNRAAVKGRNHAMS